jgi:hypothetical protein
MLALAAAGVAAADRGDPQKQITSADQTRARAMLLRRSDFGPGVKASRSSSDDDLYCEALDESDLVVTGDAESPDFTGPQAIPYLAVGSAGQVYKTAAQSAASWRRGTSSAGYACLRAAARQSAKEAGGTLVSFSKAPFPRVAPQTAAFRMRLRSQAIPGIADFVYLRNGRAQASLFFVGVPTAYPRADVTRLATLVAERMAKAMRGS